MDGTALPRDAGMMPATARRLARRSRPAAQGGRQRGTAERPAGTAAEVFWTFLRLGLTSFGGPVAHLGYFRAECVERRKWLDEHSYADIVALCQFLPGPASSQVGMGLGILRAGLPGALAAWVGFTMPSALAMILFGYGVSRFGDLSGAAWLHGLKIVAVAVVAQAVWGMARSLAPDRERATIAVGAAILALAVPTAIGQVGAIVAGRRDRPRLAGRPRGAAAAHAARGARAAALVDRRGDPVLRAAGRAAAAGRDVSVARARPCSTRSTARGRWCSAAGMSCCRCCRRRSCRRAGCRTTRFSPATARRRPCRGRCSRSPPISARSMAPPLERLGRRAAVPRRDLPAVVSAAGRRLAVLGRAAAASAVQAALLGINAAVVGLLLAALYRPVWTAAIFGPADFALGLVAFLLLAVWAVPPWLVVILGAVAASAIAML